MGVASSLCRAEQQELEENLAACRATVSRLQNGGHLSRSGEGGGASEGAARASGSKNGEGGGGGGGGTVGDSPAAAGDKVDRDREGGVMASKAPEAQHDADQTSQADHAQHEVCGWVGRWEFGCKCGCGCMCLFVCFCTCVCFCGLYMQMHNVPSFSLSWLKFGKRKPYTALFAQRSTNAIAHGNCEMKLSSQDISSHFVQIFWQLNAELVARDDKFSKKAS